MANFEEFGHTMDEEMKKLKEFFEREVKPGAKRGALEALRGASARLAELADDLERRSKDSAERPE
ncbi:MAG: hypothetical protein M1453_07375 [Acidobacteria bacterium]|nr:hypothetical protein [Acidobacteriota bacterium]MCL5287796.1 hypothetical protein [Acidobacteriota bacterium]